MQLCNYKRKNNGLKLNELLNYYLKKGYENTELF